MPLRGTHILLVDDDLDSLEGVRSVLEKAGANVTSVTSARAAMAEPGPFDVLVFDIVMPDMDGYALVRAVRMRATEGAIPAIALTAYASETPERALRAGFQEHIAKPIDPDELVALVRQWASPSAPRS